MMEYTDRFYRYLMRGITHETKLYTEMVVGTTLFYSPKLVDAELRFDESEHPIALQLGGSEPHVMRRAARYAKYYGYDEINLNCGCPSDRVAGRGCFGAAMMLQPEGVAAVVQALIAGAHDDLPGPGEQPPEDLPGIPEEIVAKGPGAPPYVTVKCRLGADDMDTYEEFAAFLRAVREAGCRHVIVHARKCWLKGLSTRDNRSIPPLRYEWAYRAAAEFPDMDISLNGHIRTLEEVGEILDLDRLPGGPEQVRSLAELAAADLAAGTPGASVPVVDGVTHRSQAAAAAGAAGPTGAAGAAAGGQTLTTSEQRHEQKKHRLGRKLAAALAQPPTPVLWTAPEAAPASASAAAAADRVAGRGSRLVHSAMVGRAAYGDPWLFADADRQVFGRPNPGLSRRQVVERYLAWLDREALFLRLSGARMGQRQIVSMIKPIMRLFHGIQFGTAFRRETTQIIEEFWKELRDSQGLDVEKRLMRRQRVAARARKAAAAEGASAEEAAAAGERAVAEAADGSKLTGRQKRRTPLNGAELYHDLEARMLAYAERQRVAWAARDEAQAAPGVGLDPAAAAAGVAVRQAEAAGDVPPCVASLVVRSAMETLFDPAVLDEVPPAGGPTCPDVPDSPVGPA